MACDVNKIQDYKKFVNEVRENLPEGFEKDTIEKRISYHVGAFIFMSWMNGRMPSDCARDLEAKLGVNNE